MMTTSTVYIELAVKVSGTVTPGFAGDRTDPPYCPDVEDVEIEDVGEAQAFGVSRFVSLLDGVDATNPEVKKVLANLLDRIRDNAVDAIVEEAAE